MRRIKSDFASRRHFFETVAKADPLGKKAQDLIRSRDGVEPNSPKRTLWEAIIDVALSCTKTKHLCFPFAYIEYLHPSPTANALKLQTLAGFPHLRLDGIRSRQYLQLDCLLSRFRATWSDFSVRIYVI